MTGQNDVLEAQREIEALQRVVARTSEYARNRTLSKRMLMNDG